MKYRSALLTLLLVLSCIGCFAQRSNRNNYHFEKLDNGLYVLIIEDSSIPIVHYDMVFRFGAKSEDQKTNGVSHLMEHMMLTASQSYPTTEEFNNEISKLGIVLNGLTNQESVHYYFSLISDNWEPGLHLFADAIVNPVFIEKELKQQQSAVKDELNMFASDPYHLLGQATKKALWDSLYTRKDISGEVDNVLNTTRGMLQNIKDKYHNPNHALLIVAGNIKRDKVITEIRNLFNPWTNSDTSEDLSDDYQFIKLKSSKYTLLENDQIENPFLVVEWQGPGISVKDQIAASLFLYALNLNASSFYADLNERDYVYEYFSGIRFGSKSSTLFMEFDTDVKTVDDIMIWLDEMIKGWMSNSALSQQTLDLAKRKLEIETIFEEEKLSEYILEIGDRWAIGDQRLSLKYMHNIQDITLEEINDVVRSYFINPRSYGLVLPPTQAKRLHKSIKNKFLLP